MFASYEARRCECRTRHTPPPNLRTHVTPAVLAYWRRLGWTVHTVGQAVYAHDPDGYHHLLVGVWPRRGPIPRWAPRLGSVSAGYERRLERCWREQAGRRNPDVPWWQRPQPVVYSWDGQP
jgi:hypothetical protein